MQQHDTVINIPFEEAMFVAYRQGEIWRLVSPIKATLDASNLSLVFTLFLREHNPSLVQAITDSNDSIATYGGKKQSVKSLLASIIPSDSIISTTEETFRYGDFISDVQETIMFGLEDITLSEFCGTHEASPLPV